MAAALDASADAKLARLDATTRALIYRYVLALSLIASLAVGAFLTLKQTINTYEASSSIINLTGRQSTLVQEAAVTARRLIQSDEPTTLAEGRGKLFETAISIERVHQRLTDPGTPLGRPVARSEEVGALYFADPLNIGREIRSFVQHAFELSGTRDAELVPEHPSFQHIVSRSSSLVIALGVLVDQLEAETTASIRHSRMLETGFLVATLFMLSLEATFIFRPIVRRVREEGARLIESQDRLVELAHYDPLTKLPNRTLFQLRLGIAVAQAQRDRTLAAVLQLDLDHFKDINDTLGHSAGDHLLCEIGGRLEQLLRSTDTVARFGGDEFALVLTGLDASHQAGKVATKIIEAVKRPVIYQNKELHSGASIGITIFPSDAGDAEHLLKNADIALYQAKSSGRNTFAFFVRDMKDRVERRAHIEEQLRLALASDAFEILYQPQVHVADGTVVAAEALLRWQHPKLGRIAPATFLSVAEETGLIVPLGSLVLERVLRQMACWLDLGIAPERIAINLSDAQLRADNFLDELDRALAHHDVEPRRLELEITESVLLGRGHEKVVRVLDGARHRGISIALDDFGTGSASLAHLKRMKVNRLKVDRSFVRDIESDQEDAAIVRAIINLGLSLGHEVIAEGVETRPQFDFLREHGCHLAQGFLLARPAPAEEIEPMLRQSCSPARKRNIRLVGAAE